MKMPGNEIRTERDVRFMLRSWVRERLFWVEPGAGGTFGMTDAIVVLNDGEVLFLELKVGTCSAKGVLRYRMRPAQVYHLKKLWGLGAKAGVLVGVKGREALFALGPSEATLQGVVNVDAYEEDSTCFPIGMWDGPERHFGEAVGSGVFDATEEWRSPYPCVA